MDDTMNEIRKVEDKYGLMPFRMGLTHMFDAGYQHFSEGDVEDDVTQIVAHSSKR